MMHSGLASHRSGSFMVHQARRHTTPLRSPDPCCSSRCDLQEATTSRRNFLASSTAVLSTAPLLVLPGGQPDAGFASVSAAVLAAEDGAVIRISQGLYRERLVLTRPVTLQAWPEGAEVTVAWETRRPYESVLESSAAGVAARGLRLRHASPSVANNYGVFVRGGSVRLEGCDITSATGSGVGAEGGALTLVGCRVHGCKGHGVALFGGLLEEGAQGTASVEKCRIVQNGQNGLLIMDNASALVTGTFIADNGAHGICTRDGEVVLEDNVVQGNRLGSRCNS